MKYTVKRTCQGQLQYKRTTEHLMVAFIEYARHVIKYGKYGTMRFDLEGW